MHKSVRIWNIVLVLLLAIAVTAVCCLWTANEDLKKQLALADEYVRLMHENENTAVEGLTRQVAEAQSAAEGLQAALTETEAALSEATAGKAAAEAQIAALTAELESCMAQLDAITAEKESADAALAALGFTRIKPPAVDPLPEETGEEVTAEESEVPVMEEGISETPGVAFVPDPEPDNSIVTVYTADAQGVAFEAPVDWIIAADGDAQGMAFVLRETERRNGVYTALTIVSMPVQADEAAAAQLEAYLTSGNGMQPGEGVPAELMGHPGLYDQQTAEDPTGVTYTRRVHAVIVDGVLYAAAITAAPEYFGAALEEVFLPACASMRMIP